MVLVRFPSLNQITRFSIVDAENPFNWWNPFLSVEFLYNVSFSLRIQYCFLFFHACPLLYHEILSNLILFVTNVVLRCRGKESPGQNRKDALVFVFCSPFLLVFLSPLKLPSPFPRHAGPSCSKPPASPQWLRCLNQSGAFPTSSASLIDALFPPHSADFKCSVDKPMWDSFSVTDGGYTQPLICPGQIPWVETRLTFKFYTAFFKVNLAFKYYFFPIIFSFLFLFFSPRSLT